jgi:hypothetical protein
LSAAAVAEDSPKWRTLDDLLAESLAAEKPNLAEMREWVEQHEPCLVQSAEAYRSVYGEFLPAQVRPIVIVRQLLRFLDVCAGSQEDLQTIFRAAAHREKFRRRA